MVIIKEEIQWANTMFMSAGCYECRRILPGSQVFLVKRHISYTMCPTYYHVCDACLPTLTDIVYD